MEIIPSIDLMNGKCVRLFKGKKNSAIYYPISPDDYVAILNWYGIEHVHIVDLDNAFGDNNAKNKEIIKKLINDYKDISFDIGGGIRTKEQIQEYFDLGVLQICIGTLAITSKEFVCELLNEYGQDKFILCPDVENEYIKTNGWADSTPINILEYMQFWCEFGARNFICTDINKDGTLTSPSVDLYQMLNNQFNSRYLGLNIIASGGVSKCKDIEALSSVGINSVIIGKALFEEKITFKDLEPWLI